MDEIIGGGKMNETEVILSIIGLAKKLPSPLDSAMEERLTVLMIIFNLD